LRVDERASRPSRTRQETLLRAAAQGAVIALVTVVMSPHLLRVVGTELG
jgi:hypothetical protein